MRAAILMLCTVCGLAIAANSAQAVPVTPRPLSEAIPKITKVWGGCGWGFHPTPWGDCVPNHYGYYRPYWRRWYWHRPYWYGGGYLSYWRHHHWYGY